MRMIVLSMVRCFRRACVPGLLLAVLLAGCATGDRIFEPIDPSGMPAGGGAALQGAEQIKEGDVLTISMSDIPNPPPAYEVKVREDGTITLLLNQSFRAAGKTVGPLEREIHERYVPKYYTQCTISIRFQNGYYFVNGEVKSPNRYPYLGKTTVLRAISSAGDFTDWANKRKVRLTRNDNTSLNVDCIKALSDPSLDLEVYPGDKIHVPRRVIF
jgi:protein involved in polysaccharide export with SLBB domain